MVTVKRGAATSLLEFGEGCPAGHAAFHGDDAVVVNIDQFLAHLRPGVADRVHDAAPIRVAAKPRAFHEVRLGDGFGGLARVASSWRAD